VRMFDVPCSQQKRTTDARDFFERTIIEVCSI